MSGYVPPARLASEADLNRSWVHKAAEHGLVNLSTLDGEDLIVVRVFAFVDQLVWPGERRSRAITRNMEPWQHQAVNAARDCARSTSTKIDSVMWVGPQGAVITHSPAEHAAYVVDATADRTSFVSIPLGQWIAELPQGLETVFKWPVRLPLNRVSLSDRTELHLAAFQTVPQQITVFVAGRPLPLDSTALRELGNQVSTHYPGEHIRVIEKPRTSGGTGPAQWWELYERGRHLVRRPVPSRELLAEYGPQLDGLAQARQPRLYLRSADV
ncbi:hypothetical protein [Streptomyces venezuelae]|uniref:hypothetical protein n=1 Tax=Streptomyces venezuelae TaxID=54571 RepID=UPI00332EC078